MTASTKQSSTVVSVVSIETARTRKIYKVDNCVKMVMTSLTPSEALHACNSPCTTQKLSYEIQKVVDLATEKGEACKGMVIDLSKSSSSSTGASTMTTSVPKSDGNSSSE